MGRSGLLLIFSLAVSTVSAGTVSVTWTAPTHRVNGAELPADEISRYDICVDYADSAPGCDGVVHVGGGALSATYAMPAGVGAVFTVRAVDSSGLLSDWSAPVSYSPGAAPQAPVIQDVN